MRRTESFGNANGQLKMLLSIQSLGYIIFFFLFSQKGVKREILNEAVFVYCVQTNLELSLALRVFFVTTVCLVNQPHYWPLP